MTPKTTHLVGHIDTANFGSMTLRIGDLNADGAPDLLYTQSDYGSRRITCLTAITVQGQILWQVGTPSADNYNVYSDLPVQIYDYDNDGFNEVLYIRQATYAEPIYHNPAKRICERASRYEGTATMVVLNGQTGEEKHTFPLPAPADDCILLADLTGQGRRQDLIVKDRYWNMWGVSHTGDVLWHWKGSPGHYPAIADVDGDGRDEVYVGYALIDHDGRVLFQKNWEGWGDEKQNIHQDAVAIVRHPDGSHRLLCGNGGLHCLAVDGTVLWHVPMYEAQHVVPGKFRHDSPLQIAVINRGHPRTPEGKPADLFLFDLDGNQLFHRVQPPGSWCGWITDIDWLGNGLKSILTCRLGQPTLSRIYDGQGDVIDEIHFQGTGGFQAARASICGDQREKALLYGPGGLSIWANTRPLAIPTFYNATLYTGV